TPDQHAYSLQHGLVVLDAAKSQACLDALQTVPCEGLITESYRATCGEALVGKVATNGFCVTPDDCQTATDICQMQLQHGCFSRCAATAPPAPIGDTCSDRACVAGAFCAQPEPPATIPRCAALAAAGESCPDGSGCAAGTYCQRFSLENDTGTCRTVQPGLACEGSWQCPLAYACLIPAGATTGTCQPGHKKGEACSFHGKQLAGGPYHDCANGLSCYPDATDHFTCGLGRQLGEACDDVDVGASAPLSIPCRVGSCFTANGKSVCTLDQKLGESCATNPCENGLVCLMDKCADPVVRVGDRCTSDGTQVCPLGARCALANPAEGTCVLLKKVGAACGDLDDCEQGASCTGSVCTACQ